LWAVWRLAVLPVALVEFGVALVGPVLTPLVAAAPGAWTALSATGDRLVLALRGLADRPGSAYIATVAAVLALALLSGLAGQTTRH
jgi:hypothetical protein